MDCLRTTTVHSQHKSQSLNKKSTCHINDFWYKHAVYMDEEKETTKQGLTGLDFEINGKNCQKMSKNAKNRENWSFAMSCSSETSTVRGGFFYIISKIMHERTSTESLVTIAR